MRKQVKKKLRKLKGENVASDSDEATSDQDDEDDEQEGETSEEEKEESAPEPEMDVTEKVRSKVNEMMRSLQASQKDAQHDGKIFV